MRVITMGRVGIDDGTSSPAAGVIRKPTVLLGLVAASGSAGISRERLQLLLWPDSAPDRARQSLSQSLYALRQELGRSCLTGGSVLQLAPGVSSDLGELRDAVREGRVDDALALAERPFFDGVAFAGCDELDRFIDRTRADVARLLESALRTHALAAPDDDIADAVTRWQRLAEHTLLDPVTVSEAARRIAALGNRAAALRLLRRHEEAVSRDLGVASDAMIVALVRELQSRTAVNADASASASAAPETSFPTGGGADAPSATGQVDPQRRTASAPPSRTSDRSAPPAIPDGAPPRPLALRRGAGWSRVAIAGGVLAAVVAALVRAPARPARTPAAAQGPGSAPGATARNADASSADARANAFLLRANEYLRHGRDGLPEARALLRQAVALDSGFVPALARLGDVQARMNWYGYDRDAAAMREARALIDRARRLSPYAEEPHVALAWWLLADHRAYREAGAELDTALALAPNDVDALTIRANIARRLGQWSRAADDYAAALRLQPASYAVALELGNTLLLMRRYADARVALEQARALSPDAVDPVVWLAALAVRERGDTAEARRVLREATPLVNAHYLVARAAQSFPELVRVLAPDVFPRVTEFSLRDAYGDTALMHVLHASRAGRPLARQAHLDSAAAVLQRRLQREPTAFAAWRALSEVYLEQARVEDALAAARRSAVLMPADSDAYSAVHSQLVLARAELRSGLRDSAQYRVARLLTVPSALSPAVLALDPEWRSLRTTSTARP